MCWVGLGRVGLRGVGLDRVRLCQFCFVFVCVGLDCDVLVFFVVFWCWCFVAFWFIAGLR